MLMDQVTTCNNSCDLGPARLMNKEATTPDGVAGIYRTDLATYLRHFLFDTL